jgi:glycosyltransferase 2 family protein
MKRWLRRWGWTVGKALLALAILVGIGRQFYLNLSELDEPALERLLRTLSERPGWLALSAGLYLLGLGGSVWFWFHLLRTFGERPDGPATVRAYYIGHLGKYVPGKGWAVLLRGNLLRGPGVRLGVAILTAFYEVLTMMASAALVAAVLFAVQPPDAASGLALHPVLVGVLLLGMMGIPLLPAVFNRLVGRLAARFQTIESYRLPRLRGTTLLWGLAATGCGWVVLGASLWATVQAAVPEPEPLTPATWARYTAMVGLSYVAGFLAFILPGGVGVREGVLERFLAPELAGQGVAQAAGVATVVVLVLRLLWTTAELVMAAAVYWLPGPRRPDEPEA